MRRALLIFILTYALGLSACVTPAAIPTDTLIPPVPLHAELVLAAWQDLGDRPDTALEGAQQCIDIFEDIAVEEQETLVANGVPEPPVGVVSDEERDIIFKRGVLNDVGTSYFIKATALENLDRIEEAREAYRGAQEFPHARTWDPGGWFWSPADAARDRLAELEEGK